MTGDSNMGGAVIAAATAWIGTPYRHQGSARGLGCDCLGLVRGVWRDLYGAEPEKVPAYAADWNANAAADTLTAAALRHFRPVPLDGARPGDLLLFSWRRGLPACHAGILAPDNRFIHAYERAGVVSSAFVPHWRSRLTGAFEFPGIFKG